VTPNARTLTQGRTWSPFEPATWPPPEDWPVNWFDSLRAAILNTTVYAMPWPAPAGWDADNWFLALAELVWERVNGDSDPITVDWPQPPGWPSDGIDRLVSALALGVGRD
jgi:hypothetical protein